MRTWGFRPDDWHDDFFTIEVRFERPPTDAECRTLGQRWAGFRGVTEKGQWSFSGPFAVLYLQHSPSGSPRDALSAFRDFLSELRPSVVEAIACNVITKEAEWKKPDPGPKFPESMRPVDKKLPELSGRPEFAAGMDIAGEKKRQAHKKKVLAAGAQEALSLEEIPKQSLTVPYPPEVRKLFDRLIRVPEGADQYRCNYHKEEHLPKMPAGLEARFDALFSPRGARALMGANQDPRSGFESEGATAVVEVGMKKPWKPRLVWRVPAADKAIMAMGWLDDDTMVATTATRLVVLEVKSGAELACVKRRGLHKLITAAGRVVVCDDSKGCRAYAWKDGKLAELGAFPGAKVYGVEADQPLLQTSNFFFRLRGA